ncbi:hypothetical protein [Polaribacter porphyrae]
MKAYSINFKLTYIYENSNSKKLKSP